MDETKSLVSSKKLELERIASELKTEFFGLDEVIDRIIRSITVWYIFPQVITRPVIVTLWGTTGCGKTSLIRRLVQKLKMQNKFVEIPMDGGGSENSYWNKTISSVLSNSMIEETKPGILLLDEMQRFRTTNERNEDIKPDRYMDVWTLLSDGKFSTDASFFAELEMMMMRHLYRKSEGNNEDDEDDDSDNAKAERKRPKKFLMSAYEANSLKKFLRLPETMEEIMQWSSDRVMQEVARARASNDSS